MDSSLDLAPDGQNLEPDWSMFLVDDDALPEIPPLDEDPPWLDQAAQQEAAAEEANPTPVATEQSETVPTHPQPVLDPAEPASPPAEPVVEQSTPVQRPTSSFRRRARSPEHELDRRPPSPFRHGWKSTGLAYPYWRPRGGFVVRVNPSSYTHTQARRPPVRRVDKGKARAFSPPFIDHTRLPSPPPIPSSREVFDRRIGIPMDPSFISRLPALPPAQPVATTSKSMVDRILSFPSGSVDPKIQSRIDLALANEPPRPRPPSPRRRPSQTMTPGLLKARRATFAAQSRPAQSQPPRPTPGRAGVGTSTLKSATGRRSAATRGDRARAVDLSPSPPLHRSTTSSKRQARSSQHRGVSARTRQRGGKEVERDRFSVAELEEYVGRWRGREDLPPIEDVGFLTTTATAPSKTKKVEETGNKTSTEGGDGRGREKSSTGAKVGFRRPSTESLVDANRDGKIEERQDIVLGVEADVDDEEAATPLPNWGSPQDLSTRTRPHEEVDPWALETGEEEVRMPPPLELPELGRGRAEGAGGSAGGWKGGFSGAWDAGPVEPEGRNRVPTSNGSGWAGIEHCPAPTQRGFARSTGLNGHGGIGTGNTNGYSDAGDWRDAGQTTKQQGSWDAMDDGWGGKKEPVQKEKEDAWGDWDQNVALVEPVEKADDLWGGWEDGPVADVDPRPSLPTLPPPPPRTTTRRASPTFDVPVKVRESGQERKGKGAINEGRMKLMREPTPEELAREYLAIQDESIGNARGGGREEGEVEEGHRGGGRAIGWTRGLASGEYCPPPPKKPRLEGDGEDRGRTDEWPLHQRREEGHRGGRRDGDSGWRSRRRESHPPREPRYHGPKIRNSVDSTATASAWGTKHSTTPQDRTTPNMRHDGGRGGGERRGYRDPDPAPMEAVVDDETGLQGWG